MIKENRIVIYIWLAVLSVICVISLVRTFYRDISLAIDYSGIMVGILGALCTVLIGWQIYNIIDFNQREQRNQIKIDRLNNILKGMQENGNRGNYLMYDTLSEICNAFIGKDSTQIAFECIHLKISAINYASRIGEYEICELGITKICCFITTNISEIESEQKNRLLRFATSIPNQNLIKNFTDLINAIAIIKTKIG